MEKLIEKLSLIIFNQCDNAESYWQVQVLFSGFAVLLLALLGAHHKLQNSRYRIAFFTAFFTAFFLSRLPLFSIGYFHPDEAEWLGYANTLLHEPLFWFSDAFATTRTFTVLPLILLKTLGFDMSFTAGKFANFFGWSVISVLIFRLHCKYSVRYAFLLTSPILLSLLHWNLFSNITYNSEVPGVILLLTIINLIKPSYKSRLDIRRSNVYLSCFLASLLPLVKLNYALFSVLFYCFIFINCTDRISCAKLIIGAWLSVWGPFFTYLLLVGEIETFYGFVIGHFGYANEGHSPVLGVKEIGLWENIGDTYSFLMSLLDFKPMMWSFSFLLIVGISFLLIIHKCQFSFLYNNKHLQILLFFFLGGLITALIPKDKLLNHAILYYLFLYLLTVCIFAGVLTSLKTRLLRFLSISSVVGAGVASFLFSVKIGNVAFRDPMKNYLGEHVAAKIIDLTKDGETFVAWGGGNDLYVQSKRIQGSRYLNMWAVLGDLPGKKIQMRNFINDVKERKPRLFIDCVHEGNWAWCDPKVFAYDKYPEIKLFVNTYYSHYKTIHGYRIFQRNESAF